MLPLSLLPPHPTRVNHFVDANEMVLKIKASTLLHAEASFLSIYMLKTRDLGAPAHPPLYQFNEEPKQR